MVSTRALETAYLYEFWTFLVLGIWGAFWGCFGGPKNTPLDVSVLGGLASESAEMPELEPAEPHFGTRTRREPQLVVNRTPTFEITSVC